MKVLITCLGVLSLITVYSLGYINGVRDTGIKVQEVMANEHIGF